MRKFKLSSVLAALVLVSGVAFLAYAAVFTGTPAADVWQGTSGPDRARGMGGNDTLYGNGGSDFIWGDCANGIAVALPGTSVDSCTPEGQTFGDDTIYGGPWHDRLFGEDGDDRIYGNTGNDYIEGGRDGDTIGDDNGNGWCDPGEEPGNDIIHGDVPLPNPESDDIDTGGVEDDSICGGDGNDIIFGEDDDDIIWGGRGLNRISAGADDDIIYVDPQSQKDIINCGDGDDTVFLFGNNRALWTADGVNFTGPYFNLMAIATGAIPAPATLDCEAIIP